MLEIPISSDAPHFSQEHLIFGSRLLLEFEWIERERYWVLHLYDSFDEKPIALGLKLSTSWPIFRDHDLGFGFLLLSNGGADLDVTNLKSFMLVAHALV